MKKTTNKLKILTVLITVLSLNASAQVSTLGNAGTFGDYVGWDASQAFSLNIVHEAAQPISFYSASADL